MFKRREPGNVSEGAGRFCRLPGRADHLQETCSCGSPREIVRLQEGRGHSLYPDTVDEWWQLLSLLHNHHHSFIELDRWILE